MVTSITVNSTNFSVIDYQIPTTNTSATNNHDIPTQSLNEAFLKNKVISYDSFTSAYNYCKTGLTLHKEGKYTEAIELFGKALKIYPNFPEALYYQGNSYAAQGTFSKAITCYKKILELSPDHQQAAYNLSVIYYNNGFLVTANNYIDKLLKLNPENDKYKSLKTNISKDLTDVLRKMDSLKLDLERYPERTEILWELMSLSSKIKKNNEIIQYLVDILDKDGDNLTKAFNFGAALAYAGEEKKAADTFELLCDKHNLNPYAVATVYLNIPNPNYQEAIKYCKIAIGKYPDKEKEYSRTLANIYYQTKDYQNGLDIYNKIGKENMPDRVMQIAFLIKSEKYQEAKSSFELFEATTRWKFFGTDNEADRSELTLYYIGASLCDASKDYTKAIKYYEKCLPFFTGNPNTKSIDLKTTSLYGADETPTKAYLNNIYLRLANLYSYSETKDQSKAITYLNKISDDAQLSPYYLEIGTCYYKNGAFANATEWLKKQYSNNTNDYECLILLASSYSEQNLFDEAVKILEPSIKLIKNNNFENRKFGEEIAKTYISIVGKRQEKEKPTIELLAKIYGINIDDPKLKSIIETITSLNNKVVDLQKSLEANKKESKIRDEIAITRINSLEGATK